jgi:glycosyltransferase involved in cell wall biosynthesis
MVRQLAGSLARSGVEIHVATTDDDGPKKLDVPPGEPVVQDGVTYWHFPRQIRFYTVSWPMSLWLSKHVADFDLVHIHALFSFAALPASYWAARRGVPYVVRPLGTLNEWGMTNRRPWLKRMSFRVIESRILKHAALVHYTSDQERREAEALGVVSASVVIPNTVSQPSTAVPSGAFRRRYPELRARRLILFLSRLDQKKGLDLLLRAFAHVRRDVHDAMLVIAGNGEDRFAERLKTETKRLGISNDVLWTGFLTGEVKQAAFADAVIYVLPSYSENFGIAVVEAMAAGVPVIVSDRVGIHADIAAAAAGLVVRRDVP